MSLQETTHFRDTPMGSERGFGQVFAAVFALIALWPLTKGGEVRFGWLAAAAVMLAVAYMAPHWLRGLNWLWFKFGLLLGAVLTPVIMGLLYGLSILPIGLLRKALGHDPLNTRWDAKAKSYWVVRSRPPEDMKNQF